MGKNPREAARSYFAHRARLAALHSSFCCVADCPRPGCKSRDMQIQATVLDLLGLAFLRSEPIEAVYRRHFYPGILPYPGDGSAATISLKIRKPCSFLVEELCTVYPARPLACMLFPEYNAVDGSLDLIAHQASYSEYRCLTGDFDLSRQRVATLNEMARMLRRELLISDVFLFGGSPFWVSLSGLDEECFREGPADCDGRCGEGEDREISPFEALEKVVSRAALTLSLPDRIEEKVIELAGSQDLQQELFSALHHNAALDKLIGDRGDGPLVLGFSRGRAKIVRGGLPSGGHCVI